MKKIAIVPARCGSKGVILKNIIKLNGIPLLYYCLDSINFSNIDECYVSTDCEIIASHAIARGVKVIDRPKNISTDESPTIECVKHAINYLNMQNNDTILTIQATNPFILSEDINKAIDLLDKHDYVISVCEEHKILWQINGDIIKPLYHDPSNRKRRQDSASTVSETGSIYGSTVKNIMENNHLLGSSNVGYIKIPKSRNFQIDDHEDIKIIERMLS